MFIPLDRPDTILAAIVFTALLLWIAVEDIRRRRVPNAAVAVLLLSGIVYSVYRDPTLAALGRSLGAMALGLVIWLPFHVLRVMGAGDVKLFAAASAWFVPAAVWKVALLAGIFGGVLALVWLVRNRTLTPVVLLLTQPRLARGSAGSVLAGRGISGTLAYGVAMVGALLVAAWTRSFGS